MFYEEHPFAQYVRILGKGRKGSRALSQEEAYASMCMILNDEVSPEQLGAFLMLMRVKEENPEELTGFVKAVNEHIAIPDTAATVQLDWSSYAGKRRQLPWFILAALTLVENGISVFMHGASGHTNGRIYTKDALSQLGLSPCSSIEEATSTIKTSHFAYLDIEYLCPTLHRIIELRPLLGLRSPVHTIARMINPFNAPYLIQGIFHPGYQPTHQQTALRLKQPHMAVVKGDGGEIERNPDLDCLVQSVHDGVMSDETWPAMFKQRHVKDAEMKTERLGQLWRGKIDDEYANAAIIGTLAIALKLMGKANSIDAAEKLATDMWYARAKDKYGKAA
ncbi:MAG: glycosyl transferase family protein [Gammaproteobacteria bacterium]|nr:glycosyl transferase family protein [Gammaproteobacteria bacterium]